jgi:ligand-binding SRPBCC domain-containing protein
LHSTSHTGETVLHGRKKGLMEEGETITWRGKHLGVWQTHTSVISGFSSPGFFEDKMVKGTFRSLRHEHWFTPAEEGTLMTDIFMYESPMGLFGKMADQLFLKTYMRKFLEARNAIIKEFAESHRGQEILLTDR